MYLILKTYANCDMEGAAVTSCAVIDVSKESLEYWLGMMDQARQVSATLGKDITLAWSDWTPACYQWTPDHEDFCEDDLEPGWCLMGTPPFPASEEGYAEESAIDLPAWNEPVRQSYCEIRVSTNGLQWFYGPKYGSVEEYTAMLARTDLDAIRHSLHTGEGVCP
jgi:hypothetical protein